MKINVGWSNDKFWLGFLKQKDLKTIMIVHLLILKTSHTLYGKVH